MKLKVVYFTYIDISSDSHGGTICCRNTIKRLAQDTEIELFVVVCGNKEQETGTVAYLNNLGVSYKFLLFQDLSGDPPIKVGILKGFLRRFTVPVENWAKTQSHIDRELVDFIGEVGADLLLIEYFYSLMFCPTAMRVIPRTMLVTQNSEPKFYLEQLKETPHSSIKRWLKRLRVIRLLWVERSFFRALDRVIALSPPDVPRGKGVYITPYLDMKPKQWKPNRSRTLFFVGNVEHHPNRQAIEFIITELAPLLTDLLPDVRFKIIGAETKDVSSPHPSVDFLGRADAKEVENQFLNSQLFICPVKNIGGMKLKMAEALSYGIPFLASKESMQSVPHLKEMPSLCLQDPAQSARTIAGIMIDEETTAQLAMSINSRQRQFIDSQKDIWSRTLGL